MERIKEWNYFGEPGRSIRVAIFDKDMSGRNQMMTILRDDIIFDVVGVFNTAKEFIKGIVSSRSDLVLINIAATGLNGLAILKQLKNEFPHVQVLVVISSGNDAEIYHSILEGASGYILKNELDDNLISSIRELRIGGSPMSPFVARRVIDMIKQKACSIRGVKDAPDYKLTSREKEVLFCIVHGKSYKMTGYELNISYETVRSHMKKIYEKLKVASMTEAVAKSINFHIV
ncbi:response regulator transcription factor [Mucilaginibacter sp. BJC16-A38]|uniref:LuxR C-terminal-related transcriptional regulator n=1 Tax=Mucilaginibacter phenanthrenivorans TaxID=1234842 RepID=UPI0021572838|nr:response regulator transcription factor [Mucilaginibacter phenanthrenivorans]MCR8557341.1 response regulator transcription factor [Mucilaginibacter phenanthrenivorans]